MQKEKDLRKVARDAEKAKKAQEKIKKKEEKQKKEALTSKRGNASTTFSSMGAGFANFMAAAKKNPAKD